MKHNFEYDYLIVGSGLFGATFAYEAKKKGKKVLVLDKRFHRGGNVYCENVSGINVHKYGAHIFHTNDKRIWDFVNSFAEFNNYINSPIANFEGELFNLPFNMNTFYQMWKTKTPEEAIHKINQQKAEFKLENPQNLEEQALAMVGKDIYIKLIKGYTTKQWGTDPKNLPASIIKRLPLRFTFDNNYFSDKYQGIPIGGYNKIVDGLLSDIEVICDVDFFNDKALWESKAERIVYTGKIDEFFNYDLGELKYRGLRFEHQILDKENFQGNAVVNYTEEKIPYTRIIEHKHFEFGTQDKTVITYEYPSTPKRTEEAYYPVNDEINSELFNKYKERTKNFQSKYIFGGRLAEYKYYDMHQVIGSALKKSQEELSEK
jgi:UDP-galactopyranose mutase